MPKPDHKPQSKAETDEEKEETYVDALLLSLRHDTTDVYIPLVGDTLPLAIKRTATAEVFTTNPGMPPEAAVDRPFGHGWTSGLTANIQFTYKSQPPPSQCPSDREDPDYTFVTDEAGAVYRFLNLWNNVGGVYNPYFMPIPTNFDEQNNFLTNLEVLNPTDTYDKWIFQFTKKYGTVLTFSAPILFYSFQTNPYSGSSPLFQNYQWGRLLNITDRYGNVLTYNGDDTSLIPTSIETSDGREIDITRSSDGLRVLQITDPLGNQVTYSYAPLTIYYPRGGAAVATQLISVQRPEGQTIQYSYATNVVRDNTPRLPPITPPYEWYYCKYNLASITDANNNTHHFNYQPDTSFQNYSAVLFTNYWYTPTGLPDIISSVTLPNGQSSTFAQNTSAPIRIVPNSVDVYSISGFRTVSVTDAEGNERSYIFDTPQLTDSNAFEDLTTIMGKGVETRFFFLIRWQRMQLQHPTGVIETFTFNPDAAMALDTVTDYSGNTTSYEYANEWSAASLFPWMDPSLFDNPIFYGYYGDPTSQTDALGNTKAFQYEDLPVTVKLVGTTTEGSTTISGLVSTAGLVTGVPVNGVGILPGTTVHSIASSTSIILSAAATVDNTDIPIGFSYLTLAGTTLSGSNTISALSSTAGLTVGIGISGTGIPAGATITAIAPSSIVISVAATASGSNVSLVFAYPASVTLTGDTASGSAVISGLASTTGLAIGMSVSGENIPAGATVIAITSTSSVTLSGAATGTATGPVIFETASVLQVMTQVTDELNRLTSYNINPVNGLRTRETISYLATVTMTGDTITGSSTIIGLTDTMGLVIGMGVSGAGIPSGTTIAAIVSSSSITLSAVATTGGTGVSFEFVYAGGDIVKTTLFEYADSTYASFMTKKTIVDGTTEADLVTTYVSDSYGYVAQESTGGISLVGNITSGSSTVTNLANTEGLAVGMDIIGTGIPPGATIATIASSTSITLSIAAFASGFGVPVTFTYPATVNLTGNMTNGSTTISGIGSTTGLVVGMGVSGTGIPSGTTVAAISSSTSIILSIASTATGSGTSLIFIHPIICSTKKYTHDANGNRTSVTDPNNNVTYFAYDGLNRLVQVTNPDSTTRKISYDPAGNKTSETNENGNVVLYTYDALNRLTQKQQVMGSTIVQTGNTISGSDTITDLATTTGIEVGMAVVGMGIPAGATVATIASSTSVTLLIPAAITLTGNTESGSATISDLPGAPTGLAIDMGVTGAGIPSGATVDAIGSLASVSLSAAATASGSGIPLVFSYPSLITTTGDTNGGSTILSNLASTAGLVVGMGVSGSNIPLGATLASIISSSSITLSVALNISASGVSLSFTYPPTISMIGDTANGSATISELPSTFELVVGMAVIGAGIPPGTTIASIVTPRTITISAAATATATGTSLDFSFPATLGMSGDATSSSTTISNLPDTTGISVGMSVLGVGIPSGTTVATVASATSITLSAAATATGSGISLIFTYPSASGMTGDTASGSTTISNLASTTDLAVGMGVSGTGIPSGAMVATIASSTSITLSIAATASGSGISLVFAYPSAFIITGDTISGSATISGLPGVMGFVSGMSVSGTSIPSGATVISADSSSLVTLSTTATATNTGTSLGFSYPTLTLTGVSLAFVAADSAIDLINKYAYNNVNSKISETDPNGNITYYAYDSIQRLVQITDALGQIWLHDFSGPNTGASAFASSDFKPTQITDPRGVRTQFVYDALYRTISKSVEYQAAMVAIGNTASGSDVITGLASTQERLVGMGVSGVGIPSGATVVAIASSTSIILSIAATASNTGILIVFAYPQAAALVGDLAISTEISNLASTTGLSVGMGVSGTDIPSGSTVAAITSPTSIVLSPVFEPDIALTFTNSIAVTVIGNTTSGSNVISGLTNTSGLVVGMVVSGSDIPSGATIATVISSSEITITADATATNASTPLAFTYPATINIIGDVTSGSDTISGLATTTGLAVGMGISGKGIPWGTTVATVASFSSITLSAAATETTAGTSLAFTYPAIVSTTGNMANDFNMIWDLDDTSRILIGMNVSGAGIPSGTTVTGIGAGSITLSSNATTNAIGVPLIFASSLSLAKTGSMTSGSPTISNLASTTGLAIGMGVRGEGIPLGAMVISIASSSVTLSEAVTASGGDIPLVFVSLSLFSTTQTQYDKVGNVIQVLDPLLNPTQTTYDALNRAIQVLHADYTTTLKTYTPASFVVTETDQAGSITTHDYDAAGRHIQIYQPDPVTGQKTANSPLTQKGYDAVGNMTSLINPLGNEWNYLYDNRNRRIEEIQPAIADAEVSGSPMENPTILTGYDGVGNVTSKTDPDGYTTYMTYDAANRLVKTTYPGVPVDGADTPLVTTTLTAHDPNGNIVSVTDEDGDITVNTHDALNRLTSTTTAPAFATTTMTGDTTNGSATISGLSSTTGLAVGMMVSGTGIPEEASVITIASSTSITISTNATATNTGTSLVFTYPVVITTLIEPGNTTSSSTTVVVDTTGISTGMAVKGTGIPSGTTVASIGSGSITLSSAATTTATGVPLVFTSPSTAIVEQFTYDQVGNRTQVIDGTDLVTSFVYDGLNRLLQTVYDPNTTAQTTITEGHNALNKVSRVEGTGRITKYGYDPLNRILEVVYLSSLIDNLLYDRDPVGNILSVLHPNDSGSPRDVSYTYDKLNRQLTETSGGVTQTHTYDPAGNRLSTNYGGTNRTVTFTYDALNHLAGIVDIAAWMVVSSAYTAMAGDRIQADTTGGAFIITLPATASVGDTILIQDAKLSWNLKNLTIARNGLLINGVSSDYTASVVGKKLSVVYISSGYGWSIK